MVASDAHRQWATSLAVVFFLIGAIFALGTGTRGSENPQGTPPFRGGIESVPGAPGLHGFVNGAPGQQPPQGAAPAPDGTQYGSFPLVATIPAGYGPEWATYDPLNGLVYVLNYANLSTFIGAHNVTVINGTSPVASVQVGLNPDSATFDQRDGFVYVLNRGTDNVSVIAGTKVIATIDVGIDPFIASYDSMNGLVYVENQGVYNSSCGANCSSISVINGTSVVATIPGLGNPGFSCYDNSTGFLYVPNGWGDVAVVNGSQIIARVLAGSPLGTGEASSCAYDDRDGTVYVSRSNGTSGSVGVINGTAVVATIPIQVEGTSVTYDPSNGYAYELGTSNSKQDAIVTVINGTQIIANLTVGNQPISAVYDSENGYVYVSNAFDPLIVNLSESNVTVIDGTHVIGDVTVGADPFYGAFDARDNLVYFPDAASDNVSVIGADYSVTFAETGLAPGTSWTASVAGVPMSVASENVSFTEPDGLYDYSIAAVPGYTLNGTLAQGRITVHGGALTVPVRFIPTSPVTFARSGLAAGTDWSVRVEGGPPTNSSAATLIVNEPNGSYTFTAATLDMAYSSPGGSFSVTGSAVSEAVLFFPVNYSVSFTVRGLPNGTTWSVALGGVERSTAGSTIGFAERNGTYEYRLGLVPGWVPSIRSASVVVDGAGVSVTVVWAPMTYLVTISESGLPAQAEWWVNTTGESSVSSVGTTVTLSLPNGSYSYGVGTTDKTYGSPGGSFVVDNGTPAVSVSFGRVVYSVTFNENGLPSGTDWSITFNDHGRMATAPGSLTFEGMTNGSYLFLVGAVAGFLATPDAGSSVVRGSAAVVTVEFARASTGPGGETGWSIIPGLSPVAGFVLVGGLAAAVAIAAVAVYRRRGSRRTEATLDPTDPSESPDRLMGSD